MCVPYVHNLNVSTSTSTSKETPKYAQAPLNYTYGYIIHFGNKEVINPNEDIGNIEYEDYKCMSKDKKEHLRNLYKV